MARYFISANLVIAISLALLTSLHAGPGQTVSSPVLDLKTVERPQNPADLRPLQFNACQLSINSRKTECETAAQTCQSIYDSAGLSVDEFKSGVQQCSGQAAQCTQKIVEELTPCSCRNSPNLESPSEHACSAAQAKMIYWCNRAAADCLAYSEEIQSQTSFTRGGLRTCSYLMANRCVQWAAEKDNRCQCIPK